jgi:hypothetical protein
MVDPIQIIPGGLSEAQADKLDRDKKRGARGVKLLCLEFIAVCLFILLVCWWK